MTAQENQRSPARLDVEPTTEPYPQEPVPPREHPPADLTVGQLLRELSQDTSHLVRQEIQLAQAEMKQKAKRVGVGAGLLGAAAVMGLAALGAGTALLIIAIAIVLPLWLSALAVTGFYVLVAGVLALAGGLGIRRATPLQPEQTVATLKEDAEWAKTRARSVRT